MKQLIKQTCKHNKQHNRVLGVVDSGDSNHSAKADAVEYLAGRNRCGQCSFETASFTEGRRFGAFKTIQGLEGQDDVRPYRLGAWFAGFTIALILALAGFLAYTVPDQLKTKQFWEYLAPASIAIIAFASLDDVNATRFSKCANLFAAIVALGVFIAGLSSIEWTFWNG